MVDVEMFCQLVIDDFFKQIVGVCYKVEFYIGIVLEVLFVDYLLVEVMDGGDQGLVEVLLGFLEVWDSFRDCCILLGQGLEFGIVIVVDFQCVDGFCDMDLDFVFEFSGGGFGEGYDYDFVYWDVVLCDQLGYEVGDLVGFFCVGVCFDDCEVGVQIDLRGLGGGGHGVFWGISVLRNGLSFFLFIVIFF